ncbi:MAG: hypothetical protein AB1665_02365 [Candidatus Thermoplasmatota archaeon]
MTKDVGVHKEIREAIVRRLVGKAVVHDSHTGGGDIAIYKGAAGRGKALSYPDIIVSHGGKALIVEIETGNKPKLLLGDAAANFHATIARKGDVPIDISKKSLLIVLPSLKIGKRGSGKPEQFLIVGEIIKSQWGDGFLGIVTELEVHAVIDKWLKGGN